MENVIVAEDEARQAAQHEVVKSTVESRMHAAINGLLRMVGNRKTEI